MNEELFVNGDKSIDERDSRLSIKEMQKWSEFATHEHEAHGKHHNEPAT